jgi:hypothetical protein
MKFVHVPPRQGLVWVRRAFEIFLRQPLGFASLFAACALIFFVLVRVPWVGQPILLVVAPAGSLLFMIASRRSVAGERPVPGAFVELVSADRSRLLRMLKLGLAYLVAAFLAIGLIALVEGDGPAAPTEVSASAQASPELTAEQLADPRVQVSLLLRLVLGALLSIPFWHAPGLVYWGAQGWGKALFFSTMAIWRNKGAFTIYGLAWLGLGLLFAMLLALVIAVTGPLPENYIATPLILVFMTVLYASLWFTFADCFVEDSPTVPPASA